MSNLMESNDQSYRNKYSNTTPDNKINKEDSFCNYISKTETKSPENLILNKIHNKNSDEFNTKINENSPNISNDDSNSHPFQRISRYRENFSNDHSKRQSKNNNYKNLFLDYSDNFTNNISLKNKDLEETEKVFQIKNLSYMNNNNIPNSKKSTWNNFAKEEQNRQKSLNKSIDKSKMLFYSSSQDFENDNKNNYENNKNNIDNNSKDDKYDKNNLQFLNIIEKDRMIFEYSKIIKDFKIEKEEILKDFENKEEIIKKLFYDNKILNTNLKTSQKNLIEKEEKSNQIKELMQEKISKLEKEKVLFESKYNEISKNSDNQKSEIHNLTLISKKLEVEIGNLKKIIKEKDDLISKSKSKLEDLKKENLNIPTLKKSILDLESKNFDLLNEINTEKDITKKFLKGDNLDDLKNLCCKDYNESYNYAWNKSHSKLEALDIKYNSLLFDNENLKKELVDKNKELDIINEKYKNIFSENENFIKYITCEILKFNNFVEHFQKFNMRKETNLNSNSFNDNNFINNEQSNLSINYSNNDFKTFSLQYDIIKINFESIKKNFENKYNENFEMYIQIEKSNKESERKLKDIQAEKDAIYLDFNASIQKLKELNENSNNLFKENKHLLELLSSLQNSCLKLKSEIEELKVSNQEWKRLKNNALYNITEKISFLHSKFDLFFSFEKANEIGENKKDHKDNFSGSEDANENEQTSIKQIEEEDTLSIFQSKYNIENQLNNNSINKSDKCKKINESKNCDITADEKYEICPEKDFAFIEELCSFVDWLILEYSKIYLFNKELIENLKAYKNENQKIKEEKNCLDKRIDTLILSKEKEFSNIQEEKYFEIQSIKEAYIEEIDKVNKLYIRIKNLIEFKIKINLIKI